MQNEDKIRSKLSQMGCFLNDYNNFGEDYNESEYSRLFHITYNAIKAYTYSEDKKEITDLLMVCFDKMDKEQKIEILNTLIKRMFNIDEKQLRKIKRKLEKCDMLHYPLVVPNWKLIDEKTVGHPIG